MKLFYLTVLLPLLAAATILLCIISYSETPLSVFQNGYLTTPPAEQWHAHKFWHDANSFPLCTMDSCFNFSRCANTQEFLIYAYGPPYAPSSYFNSLNSSPWVTTDPSQACVFLVTEPQFFSFLPFRAHPSTLPFWNGGLNHIIVTLADKWSDTAPPPHTIGNASVLASCLKETTYRAGFDIAIPLPGRTHLPHLQILKPWRRRYFLTFKGTRYIGHKEGNFRSDPAFRSMHNGEDVIVAVTCNHKTNNKIRKHHPEQGEGCGEDEVTYKQYDFNDLMNSTFGLAPAGRSPSSYRMIEILSAGTIPVLIADNYVKPFDTMIQWHRCMLQFPTSELARIVPALRAMGRQEMESRQRYCVLIYEEYLKDDATLLSAAIKSLKLRFYGMLPQFNETLLLF